MSKTINQLPPGLAVAGASLFESVEDGVSVRYNAGQILAYVAGAIELPPPPDGGGDGDVTGPSLSVDGEVALFSGTTGKLIRRAAGSGYPKLTDGVQSVQSAAQLRAELGERVEALTDAATIAVDAALANNFRVTLGGNRTLGNPSNLANGQHLFFRVKQDGTGTRTLAYGSMYKFAGGTAPVLSTAAGALDILACQYDAADGTLVCTLNKAFA